MVDAAAMLNCTNRDDCLDLAPSFAKQHRCRSSNCTRQPGVEDVPLWAAVKDSVSSECPPGVNQVFLRARSACCRKQSYCGQRLGSMFLRSGRSNEPRPDVNVFSTQLANVP